MKTTTRYAASIGILASSIGVLACSSGGVEEQSATTHSALEACTFQAPLITAATEETPGPVAAGIHKIYHVTAENQNGTGCGPATLSFVPDSFHFFGISAQPTSIAGVSSGATASYRVDVVSDPSVLEGVYSIGFTIVNLPAGTSVRGSLRYEVSFNNPVGCNRQPPAIAVSPASPLPVPAGGTQNYVVTVRNVDNQECGPDSFALVPDSFHFFSITTNGPFVIGPQGSASYNAQVTSASSVAPGIYDLGFTVVGSRHGALVNRGSLRYQVQ